MSSVTLSTTAKNFQKTDACLTSFLSKIDLSALSRSSKKICVGGASVSEILLDSHIWKPKALSEFGIRVESVKQNTNTWKSTFLALQHLDKARMPSAQSAPVSPAKKMDDLHYRTAAAGSRLLGLPHPLPITHYYPTGQVGYFGGRKITVYRSTST